MKNNIVSDTPDTSYTSETIKKQIFEYIKTPTPSITLLSSLREESTTEKQTDVNGVGVSVSSKTLPKKSKSMKSHKSHKSHKNHKSHKSHKSNTKKNSVKEKKDKYNKVDLLASHTSKKGISHLNNNIKNILKQKKHSLLSIQKTKSYREKEKVQQKQAEAKAKELLNPPAAQPIEDPIEKKCKLYDNNEVECIAPDCFLDPYTKKCKKNTRNIPPAAQQIAKSPGNQEIPDTLKPTALLAQVQI